MALNLNLKNRKQKNTRGDYDSFMNFSGKQTNDSSIISSNNSKQLVSKGESQREAIGKQLVSDSEAIGKQ